MVSGAFVDDGPAKAGHYVWMTRDGALVPCLRRRRLTAVGLSSPSNRTASINASLMRWSGTAPSRYQRRGARMVRIAQTERAAKLRGDPALDAMEARQVRGLDLGMLVSDLRGKSTSDFARLFMMPGVAHCGGGIGPDRNDAVTAVIDWVGTGKAPDALIASKVTNGQVARTRPLCPYPQVARYKGQGSIDDAANFSCVAPR